MSKILIVEDDPANLKLFRDVIGQCGHNTLHSVKGRDAIQIASSQHPDLVVLDIRLPDISGFEVARRLKERNATKNIPIVAVSAYVSEIDEDEVRRAGCDIYISKPIAFRIFMDILHNALKAANDR